jgi:SAM-dependent methyltransferase
MTSKVISMSLIDTIVASSCAAPPSSHAHPQSLLDLPPGEARESLLAMHRLLADALPTGNLAIYEAGGGSTSFLPLDLLKRAHITVIDIDGEQLCNNYYAQEKILGDIQTFRFPRESFDLITCYNVLEHVPDVAAALNGICDALKRGGLILIGAPNPKSLSGVLTKYSPRWFHVCFYRYVKGDKLAGLPGQPPFRTFYHPLVTPSKLVAFAAARGLEVIYRKVYESPRFPEMRARMPLLAAALDALSAVLNLVLPKNADVRHGDYHIILRKR